MITNQEYADLMEIYGSLDAALEYFETEEEDHEILPRLQAELRRARLECLLRVVQVSK